MGVFLPGRIPKSVSSVRDVKTLPSDVMSPPKVKCPSFSKVKEKLLLLIFPSHSPTSAGLVFLPQDASGRSRMPAKKKRDMVLNIAKSPRITRGGVALLPIHRGDCRKCMDVARPH